MTKQEEIIEVEGKKVVVRHSNNSTDCCKRCAFWANTCTAEDDPMVLDIPCKEYDKVGKYAYFVLAERSKSIIIAQESPANNIETGLEAEVDKEIQKLHTAPCYDELQNFAHHFVEWERKRTLDKVVEWMKKNLTYVHPRKEVETCMVNIPAFLDAMNEENT